MQKSRQGGFTLAELLIVVAIIAVLVAIAIPIFTSQLEKSREAADAANIRSQYAEVIAESITTGGDVNTDGSAKVTLKQRQDGWQNQTISESLGNLGTLVGSPSTGGTAWVELNQDDAVVTIHFEGGSESGGTSGGGSTPEEAHAHNTATANSIGDTVVTLLNQKGSDPNTKVTITVDADGKVGVSVSGHNAKVSETDVLEALGLSNGGTVDFETNDNIYSNGYKITIIKNNGSNGGSIHVAAI